MLLSPPSFFCVPFLRLSSPSLFCVSIILYSPPSLRSASFLHLYPPSFSFIFPLRLSTPSIFYFFLLRLSPPSFSSISLKFFRLRRFPSSLPPCLSHVFHLFSSLIAVFLPLRIFNYFLHLYFNFHCLCASSFESHAILSHSSLHYQLYVYLTRHSRHHSPSR